MSFEVSCGQCQGRLLVEQVGVVVACPHCGSHLTVGTAPEQADHPQSDECALPEQVEYATSTASVESAAAPSPSVESGVSDFASFATRDDEHAAPSFNFGRTDTNDESAAGDSPSIAPELFDAAPRAADVGVESMQRANEARWSSTSPGSAISAENTVMSVPEVSRPKRTDGVSRGVFLVLLSYASAMTLAVAFLVWTRVLNPSTHNLESLPDIEPPRHNKSIAYKFVPWNATVAPGHVLRIGEARRYGNLKVTALKVTRESLTFEHLERAEKKKEPIDSVLKLWLKFENVSDDQSIAPLKGLVFYRTSGKDYDHERSNNFVCKASEKTKGDDGDFVLMYELNTNDIWILTGQDSDHEIPAGQSQDTYIATVGGGADRLAKSGEEMVWRVHFRKGYSPENYGVTTVVEVAFNESDVQAGAIVEPKAGADNKAKS